jgi:ATP-dependent DNA ligase
MGAMDLPVMPPVAPMLAKSAPEIPDLGHVEPKWDGFRTIVFRDGDEVVIGSRNEKPLTRYFPDLVAAVLEHTPERCVLDGEIVRVEGDRLDFDVLSQRIHPAESRVRLLAAEKPVSLVAFDLLALGDADLTGTPFRDRRARLVDALGGARDPVFVTPATADLAEGRAWFEQFEGAGLDGVVAKPLDGLYQPGRRTMTKVKHARTADCVVAGFRRHTSGDVVGSLLLGLWTEDGRVQHVGVAASFPMARRASLMDELAPYREGVQDHPWAGDADAAGAEGRRLPGATSRWTGGKDLSFVPLRPELVVEVGYDHLEGDRFRHTAQFKRWRPDREAASCTYAQLDEPVGYRLSDVLRPV